MLDYQLAYRVLDYQLAIGARLSTSYTVLDYQLAIRWAPQSNIMVKRKYAFYYDRVQSSYSFNGKPETGAVPGYR